MIRFLFRFVGLLLLALAFVFLVYDGTKSIADQRIYLTTIAEVWAALHEASLAQVRPALEGLTPWLWDPVAETILSRVPAWLVLVVLGALLVLIGRKPRPLIGYARD
jgi:peptidoglycan/LPS O-acetylase OafA/YrhL